MKITSILTAAVFAAFIIAFAPAEGNGKAGFASSVSADIVTDESPDTVYLTGNITEEDLYTLKDPSTNLSHIKKIEAKSGSVLPQHCAKLFEDLTNITSIDLSKADGSKVIRTDEMFYGCENLVSVTLCDFNSDDLGVIRSMFGNCYKLETINFGKINTSNVTDMSFMFNNCNSLQYVNAALFDTSNVENMDAMFCDCSALNYLDLSHFNMSKVKSASSMFSGCESLETIDLSASNASILTDTSGMFRDCKSAKVIDLGNFNTDKLINMSEMFEDCKSVETLDLSGFNVGNDAKKYDMFSFCESLTKLTLGENFGNVTKDMSLPLGYNGWANINAPTVKVSNSNSDTVINNTGKNTYIKIGEYGGSGTESDPFIIYDYKQLYTLFSKYDNRLAVVYFKLGADISTGSSGFETVEKTGYADYYLDLSGHSITVDMPVTKETSIFRITSGKLTIGDSKTGGCICDKTTSNNGSKVTMFNYKPSESNSEFTINGGSYIYESEKGTHTVINADAPQANNSKLNINGGIYKALGKEAYIEINIQDCETSIRNGDFYSAYITYTDVNEAVNFYSCTVTDGQIHYVPFSTNDNNTYVPSDAIKNMERAFPLKPAGDQYFEPVLVDYIAPKWGKSSYLIGTVIEVRNYDFPPGDVNFDTEISDVDAAIVMKYINGLTEFTAAQTENADIYDNDTIDLIDVINILKIAAEE